MPGLTVTPALDVPGALRTAILFRHRVGRTPKRRDFRSPDKVKWEELLGVTLPSADQVARHFGSWSKYLEAAGLPSDPKADFIQRIEEVALKKVREVYPDFEVIPHETGAFDGYLGDERVEIKGSSLSFRTDNPELGFFSFKTHGRKLSKVSDRAIFVGVGIDRETGAVEPLVVMNFPKAALGFIDSKSTVMVYASAVFGTGSSQYSPYIVWRAKLKPDELARYCVPGSKRTFLAM